MGIRTVRLDGVQERLLASVWQRPGRTISELLKRGLRAYAESARKNRPEASYEKYVRLDLGPRCYALAPAQDAKAAVAELITRNSTDDPDRQRPVGRPVRSSRLLPCVLRRDPSDDPRANGQDGARSDRSAPLLAIEQRPCPEIDGLHKLQWNRGSIPRQRGSAPGIRPDGSLFLHAHGFCRCFARGRSCKAHTPIHIPGRQKRIAGTDQVACHRGSSGGIAATVRSSALGASATRNRASART